MKMRVLGLVLLCFLSSVVFAQNAVSNQKAPDPMIMMNQVSNEMLDVLKKNSVQFKSKPRLVYSFVRKIVIPHADVAGMSRSVLGRNVWNNATQKEQVDFIREFTNVVIGTYASALNAYTDQTIQFDPIRGGYEGQSRLKINSRVIRKAGPPIPVVYSLILKNGQWMMYDLSVEGVGLLQSFRSQFSDQLYSQGKTLRDIINDLHERDQKKS